MGNDTPRLIRFDGSDNDYLYFSTPSWTLRGVRYDITVNKRDGIVNCNCMGAVCHHKSCHLVDLLEGKPVDACKHISLLGVRYLELLRAL